MERNNLKKLASCLFILCFFIFAGCARQGMDGSMDKSMETKMEGTMDPMKEKQMEKPMPEMTDQKMGETVMEESEMGPAKETMMK